MNKAVKTKLCWSCEGVVATTAETCPYCGVSVIPASLDGTPANFSPPYRMGSSQEMAVPRSPYAAEQSGNQEAEEPVQEEAPHPSLAGFKTLFFCLICLFSGSTFLIFGTALALFSQNGVFSLQWNADHWFIYAGLSLPLMLIGWRLLNRLV